MIPDRRRVEGEEVRDDRGVLEVGVEWWRVWWRGRRPISFVCVVRLLSFATDCRNGRPKNGGDRGPALAVSGSETGDGRLE